MIRDHTGESSPPVSTSTDGAIFMTEDFVLLKSSVFFNRILFNCPFVGDFVLAALNILLDQFLRFVLEFSFMCAACSFPGSLFSALKSRVSDL